MKSRCLYTITFLQKRVARLFTSLVLFAIISAFAPDAMQDLADINHKPTLFYLGRNRDANQILYKLNLEEDGKLNQDTPIEAHWIKFTHNGKVEPITWIQNQFAFGFKYIDVSDYTANFHFAPYDKKNLFLKKVGDTFKVFTYSENQYVSVDRIMVHYNGGTEWLPAVEYVELFSTSVSTGKPVLEIIYP
jgi:hypothetical protein